MNFIAKNIQIIGLLLLTGFVAAAAVLYFDLPARPSNPKTADTTGNYSCPMHPDVSVNIPGNCPKCGMELTSAAAGTEIKRMSCEHAVAGQNAEAASGHVGCNHTEEEAVAGGCCSKRPQPATSGCTRYLVGQGDNSTP